MHLHTLVVCDQLAVPLAFHPILVLCYGVSSRIQLIVQCWNGYCSAFYVAGK